jgi:oxygen-independent coproporphyrinogen-3 oxidase
MTPLATSVDTVLPPHAVMTRFEAGMPALCAYPAPNRFVEAVGSDDVLRALRQRRLGTVAAHGAALSLQITVPFRERPSGVRGCTQVITRRHDCAQRYLQGLRAESDAALAAMGKAQLVSRVRIGGAAPLFMSDDQLAALLSHLRESFPLSAEAEVSIQAAESLCTPARVARLRDAGFNRLDVELEDDGGHGGREARLGQLMQAARAAAFSSVAMELTCGAPGRGAASLVREAERVVALRPDRIRMIRPGGAVRPPAAAEVAPPDPASQFDATACRLAALQELLSAGYQHLGLDEFALATGPLAVAWRQGRLHLGPSGLSVKPEGDVLALGLAAEGRIGNIVYRNVDALSPYYAAMADGRLPVARGLALSRDELARKGVISGLLCQGRVDFESINLSHLIDMRRHFAGEFALLEPLIQAGLVDVDSEAIELTATGRWFAPTVAAVFDRELQRDVLRSRTACID